MKFNLFIFLFSLSTTVSASATASDFEVYLQNQERFSAGRLFQNISREDTAKGAVIASPSRQDPDYYYHWIRDSALTMETVVTMYSRAQDANAKRYYFNAMVDYINFEHRLQLLQAQGGLGEPKFRVDGTLYNEPWGRPQNDGPALRAITLTRFASILIQEGNIEFVQRFLYSTSFSSMIKMDLEYIVKNWSKPCFDLWEEVSGHHFYTRIVQRKALMMGARLAQTMNDPHAATHYLQVSQLLTRALRDHWNPQHRFLVTTFGPNGGLTTKHSQLDSAQILGVLHANTFDDFLNPSSDMVLATLSRLVDTFKRIYPINLNTQVPGVAIGRYPEDVYYGGNPWFLTTHAVAENLYLAALDLMGKRQINLNSVNLLFFKYFLSIQDLNSGEQILPQHPKFKIIIDRMLLVGDMMMKRVKAHKSQEGNLAEQFNKNNGYMMSARDLTWSYASFLTAKWSRDRLLQYYPSFFPNN